MSRRVPLPTNAEFTEAFALNRAITACSGAPFLAWKAMNIAFRNDDISTVYLDETGALTLRDALVALFPSIESAPASRAIKLPDGAVQAGWIDG